MNYFLSKRQNILLGIAVLIFSICVYTACQNEKENAEAKESVQSPETFTFVEDHQFVGSETCMECHSEAYEDWKGSHHDLAMQKATEETVLADFNDTQFTTQEGMKSHFYKKDGEFWVNTEGPDGQYGDYKIVYTYGITPLQQYIVKFPDGKYQCLLTAWDTEEEKWFDLYPQYNVVHEEWLHWTKGAMSWNTMCSDCHSTNIKKNYDEKTDSFNTTYAIINVSCEACHGPGKAHTEAARREGYEADPISEGLKMTHLTKPKQLVDDCARCHIRREQLTMAYNWEGSMIDHYLPQLLTEQHYFADGQILDEVYVWGSFVQSKMYMNHITCTDCHNPHSMELKVSGNTLCLECHEPEKYDVELHTFHEKNTEGAACIDCHMPGRFYMVNDFRRDHSFRVPRPDLSVKYGTPNACNGCHEDQSADWAWEKFQEWYGEPDSSHFSEALALGRTGDPAAIEALQQLIANDQQPPIARATAINYLGRYPDETVLNGIVQYLKDSDPLVRTASVEALDNAAPLYFTAHLWQGLNDPKRAVRIKTFEALAGVQMNQIPQDFLKAYEKVRKEFYDYQKATADFPGGQTNKALYYERTGQTQKALEAYKRAIEMDNYNNMARFNLANLYYRLGQMDMAEATFKKVMEQEPDYAETYYSLGLLYAELNRNTEAISQLRKALDLNIDNPRVYYNLGLLYQNGQAPEKAAEIFEKGLQRYPGHENLLYAMAYLQVQVLGDVPKARKYAHQLIKRYPDNENYQLFWKQLNAQ